MSEASLVVYERTPRWVPELKRRFLDSAVIIRGCSSSRDVLAAVEQGTRVVVLVLDGGSADCLEIAGRLATRTVPPQVIAIAGETCRDLEWPLREMGVTSVVSNRITSDELSALCLRLLEVD